MFKTTRLFFLFTILIFVSCDYTTTTEDLLVGKWVLISISSEINGEESVETLVPNGEVVCYNLKSDSTYVLTDLGESESGIWIVSGDSMLGFKPKGCSGDTQVCKWMHFEKLNDSLMVLLSSMNTDYGVVSERHMYRKLQVSE